jgi:hypothetical protein
MAVGKGFSAGHFQAERVGGQGMPAERRVRADPDGYAARLGGPV